MQPQGIALIEVSARKELIVGRAFPPRFVTPSTLASIDPVLLCQLFRPYQAWLRQAGIRIDDPSSFSVEALSLALMTGVGIPDRLVELICLIDDLSTPRAFDRVRQCAHELGMELDPDITGHDLAVRVMLTEPNALMRLRTEIEPLRRKQFDRYMAIAETIPRPYKRTKPRLRGLQRALDEEFVQLFRQRGDGVVKIHAFDETNGFRLMIRRGDTRRAQPTINDTNESKTKLLVYRPELYDVVRFDQRFGDLLINAKSKAKIDVRTYCYLIGQHLFGDRFAFDPNLAPRRYTLEPIREYGHQCLSRAYVEGIANVRLDMLLLKIPGLDQTLLRIGPGDVFSVLHHMFGDGISQNFDLHRAVLKVRLRGERRERAVCIAPPISATYERDNGSELIDQFIESAEFLLTREESLRGAPETLFSLY